MPMTRRWAPWVTAAIVCALAVGARQFLIQPPEIAHRCDTATLTLITAGPWWCGIRAAIIMTYAWGGLFYAAIILSFATLWIRRAAIAFVTLAIGLIAIVWYTYEPGAVAITIGTLVLARAQSTPRTARTAAPTDLRSY